MMLVNSDSQSVTWKMRSPGPLFHAPCHCVTNIHSHAQRTKDNLVKSQWCTMYYRVFDTPIQKCFCSVSVKI